MRRGFGFLWVTLTGIVLAAVGVIAYQAGWAAGAATQLPAGAAAAPYYYYGPHFDGFGFLGFLFILFLLFVLFRIARFSRGWGYGGHRGWGGYGYGSGKGGVPPAIEERMQEWHKRAHGEPAPAPPSDTKTI